MSFSLRRVAPVVLLACIGMTAGCGSNNKGKIEGKWKIVAMPKAAVKDKESFEGMSKMGIYVYMEFKPDGIMTFGIGAEKPELLQLIQAADSKKTNWDGKYKLLSGNSVELYDLPKDLQSNGGGGLFGKKDRARVKIEITGDDMSLTDDEGTAKLTRVK